MHSLLGLDPASFLRHHWQRRPLLLRGAWPGFTPPFHPRDILRLASDERSAPRRVWQTRNNWQVEHGPFSAAALRRPPAARWTVLVPDVDKLFPAAAPLLDHFGFLPGWRQDDLMVSYAVDGGSVGPHVDEYDVFLLQGHGRRRWSIQTRGVQPEELRAGTGLKILRCFRAEQSWVLEPGDLLYLPPGVAHHGVAAGECTTLSFGFRAPNPLELAVAWGEECQRRAEVGPRYRDQLVRPSAPGLLDTGTRQELLRMTTRGLAAAREERERWLGRFLTEPGLHSPDPPARRLTQASLSKALARPGAALRRHPAVRALWFERQGTVWLYVDGAEYRLPRRWLGLVRALCLPGLIPASSLAAAFSSPLANDIINWFNNGTYLIVKQNN